MDQAQSSMSDGTTVSRQAKTSKTSFPEVTRGRLLAMLPRGGFCAYISGLQTEGTQLGDFQARCALKME